MPKPPRTNIDKELEKILEGIEIEQWPESGDTYLDDLSLAEAKEKIKQAFLKWVEELCGEEEKDETRDIHTSFEQMEARNQLRREIKERSKEMFG